MKNCFLIGLIFIAGCQTSGTNQRLVQIEDKLDKQRLRLYEINLATCAAMTFSCLSLVKQEGKDPLLCNQALFECVKNAEDKYREDTGKEPPGLKPNSK